MVSQEQILDALRKVEDPDLHKDVVSLKMIRDLKIEGDVVRFTLHLTTPACPMKDRMRNDAEKAVLALPGVREAHVNLDATVVNDGRNRGVMDVPVRNAIAIGSGKGGVGKSTVAVNVAVALAQTGATVGLLDADIYGPNVPTMMGVKELPPPKGNKITPAEAYGVKMMSIGFLVKPEQPLIWRGPMLHSSIKQFISDVAWGDLDYLIVDLPPGTGDAPLSLAQSLSLSGGVIVTLPQDVSLEDARRGLYMFEQLQVPVFGVVENMSYLEMPDGNRLHVFGSGGGKRLAKEANVPFLGMVPMDPSVSVSGDSGKPIVVSQPDSPVAQALKALAEQIAAQTSIAAYKRSNNVIPINLVG